MSTGNSLRRPRGRAGRGRWPTWPLRRPGFPTNAFIVWPLAVRRPRRLAALVIGLVFACAPQAIGFHHDHACLSRRCSFSSSSPCRKEIRRRGWLCSLSGRSRFGGGSDLDDKAEFLLSRPSAALVLVLVFWPPARRPRASAWCCRGCRPEMKKRRMAGDRLLPPTATVSPGFVIGRRHRRGSPASCSPTARIMSAPPIWAWDALG